MLSPGETPTRNGTRASSFFAAISAASCSSVFIVGAGAPAGGVSEPCANGAGETKIESPATTTGANQLSGSFTKGNRVTRRLPRTRTARLEIDGRE